MQDIEFKNKKDKLLYDIKQAFSNIQRPNPEEIVPVKKYTDIESDQVREFLANRTCNSLTAKIIWDEYCGDPAAIIAFLGPIGFCYFLPAFLSMCLCEYDTADIVIDSVWNSLGQSAAWNLDGSDYLERRLQMLTPAQKNVVARTLFLVIEEQGENIVGFEIEEGLCKRWRPFL